MTTYQAIEESDAKRTRQFVIFNILVGHCDEKLTERNVESIAEELIQAIEKGSCAWAFEFLGRKRQ